MPEKRPGGALREGWQVTDDVQEIEKLRGITFLNRISPEAEKKWDVSQNREGSVMAMLEKQGSGDGEYYELYIGAEGGVQATADSRGLFPFGEAGNESMDRENESRSGVDTEREYLMEVS